MSNLIKSHCLVIFDEGLEFYNKYVNMLFQQYNIHSYLFEHQQKLVLPKELIEQSKACYGNILQNFILRDGSIKLQKFKMFTTTRTIAPSSGRQMKSRGQIEKKYLKSCFLKFTTELNVS